jgi:integrase/recombinase XerD
MNKTPYDWKSMVSQYLKGFLDERHLAGYRFRMQERWIKQFDWYCFEKGIHEEQLNKNLLEEFCHKNRNESAMTCQKRLCLMRQFAEYMLKNGYVIELPPTPDKVFSYPIHNPYIFTEHELKDIFVQIDNWIWTSQSRGYRKQMDPVLFRMIYGCGLRIMEALRLRVTDVNLEAGYLSICDSKNGRDRIVPMAESLVIRCKAYSKQMHALSSPDNYYFPGAIFGSHSSHSSAYHRFREYLWKAGIPHTGHGPRIHDLRHAFCVHRFKKWVLSGSELMNLMPYLSAYLGHVDFRGTEYYLRLTADLYPEIIAKLEYSHGYVIPERGGYNK